MNDPSSAQASVFVTALTEQVISMASRLSKIERETEDSITRRNEALRSEAAELRRDISHAQFLIRRLHRCYPVIAGDAAAR